MPWPGALRLRRPGCAWRVPSELKLQVRHARGTSLKRGQAPERSTISRKFQPRVRSEPVPFHSVSWRHDRLAGDGRHAARQFHLEHGAGAGGQIVDVDPAAQPADQRADDVESQAGAGVSRVPIPSPVGRNGRRSSAACSGGIPRPLSQTRMTAQPSSTRARDLDGRLGRRTSRRCRADCGRSCPGRAPARGPYTARHPVRAGRRRHGNAGRPSRHTRSRAAPRGTSSTSPSMSAGLEPAGVEHLVDQLVEPLDVLEHRAVKVRLLLRR